MFKRQRNLNLFSVKKIRLRGDLMKFYAEDRDRLFLEVYSDGQEALYTNCNERNSDTWKNK